MKKGIELTYSLKPKLTITTTSSSSTSYEVKNKGLTCKFFRRSKVENE